MMKTSTPKNTMSPKILDSSLYIDTDAALERFCETISTSPWIGIDTEFIREKTYKPRICLIQLSTPDHIACIDPFQVHSITPLQNLIGNEQSVKILHSAYQDMETLLDYLNILPSKIFDTQVAAALLGFGDQIGYANLVKEILDIDVNKDQSRTDWSKRPLTLEQRLYAANDVRYLGPLYIHLSSILNQKKRMDWLIEDFQKLTDKRTYQQDPKTLWKKVRGARKLSTAQLPILQQLTAWREHRATIDNLPRKWIIPDDLLIELSRRSPETMNELDQLRGWTEKMSRKYGREILKEIQKGRTIPKAYWPSISIKPEPSLAQEAVLDAMMAIVKIEADKNRISPALLASRNEVEKFFFFPEESALCKGWKKHLIGNRLSSFLAGEKSLSIHGEKLTLEGYEITQRSSSSTAII